MTADDISHFWVFLVVLAIALLGGAGVFQVAAWRCGARSAREVEAEATELDAVRE